MKNEIDENRKKVYIVLSLYISLLTAQMCHFFVHDFCKKEKNKSNIKKVNCVLEF